MAAAAGFPQAAAGMGGPGPSRPVVAPELTATPLLSVRRMPGWVAETSAAQRLQPEMASILRTPALGSAVRTSCLVATQGSLSLYSANPVESLLPASNMKLLTATAVVDRLAASHRFVTRVAAARPLGGVVRGDLFLVGAGDPLLRTASYVATLGSDQPVYTSLDQLARQVRAEGVTSVTGSVVGDESHFDQLRTVPTWEPIYAEEGDSGPLSALDVNDGFPMPTASSSKPPSSTTPPSSNPAVEAAATFTALLGADGVKVAGPPTTGRTPVDIVTLTSIASAPVGAEVDQMLIVSDDTAAELFTKELGYLDTGLGTTASGVAAIRSDLAADGLPVSQLVGDDGSGLDRGDRVTCDLLHADLEHVGPDSVVARGLPIAGQTGTLSARMVGTPAAGRLRAKTGTLDDVVALSGFVTPGRGPVPPGSVIGQPIVFSIILNNVTDEAGIAIVDELGVALAGYPRLPHLADIEPLH